MQPTVQRVSAMLAAEAAGVWALEVKVDGVRSLIHVGASRLRIDNRAGRDWSAQFPEVAAAIADAAFPAGTVLDCEIAVLDVVDHARADFAATASRAKLTRGIAAAAMARPAHAHVFDVPVWGTRDLTGEPYAVRRTVLDEVVAAFEAAVFITETTTTGFAALWDDVLTAGGEGVVAKHLSSTYAPGPSRAWRKTKVAHTTTAVAVGYEGGRGARGFGALHLALVSPQLVVPAGRVGSGLSEAEIAEITAAIDAGEMPVVEIAHNGTTEHGHLRHPVYLGRRTDATWRDATTDQNRTTP